jgi:hypothetical protein
MMAEKKSRFSCNNNYDRVPTTIHATVPTVFHSNLSCPLLRDDTKKNVNAVAYWEHGIWRFSPKK